MKNFPSKKPLSWKTLHICRDFHDSFHVGCQLVEKIMFKNFADAFQKVDVKILFTKNQITVCTVAVYALREPLDCTFLTFKFFADKMPQMKLRILCFWHFSDRFAGLFSNSDKPNKKACSRFLISFCLLVAEVSPNTYYDNKHENGSRI